MPFWSETNKIDYKARLEHKMCIAKETPESIFDLADCNLSEIPSGVFSMCRVFRKECLLLQNNHVTSLQSGGSLKDLSMLLVLNLSNNKLSSLPSDIAYLNHLQDLNLENNRLKKLPDSFQTLMNLQHLNLNGNRFQVFPSPVCSLRNLKTLNLCGNPKVKTLPDDLCNLLVIKQLHINAENFIYPPSDVCLGGTEAIMKFLCEATGKEYNAVDHVVTPNQIVDENTENSLLQSTSDLDASYLHYQRAKEHKMQELVQMEEALKESYEMQCSCAADANLKRQKLFEDITQEQERMDAEILLLQDKKEKEKQNLLNVLTNIENHSATLLEQLMSLNDRTKNMDTMLAVLERDRIENEEIFTLKQEELEQVRKNEILEAMTEILQCEEKQRQYEISKNNVTAELQNDENESNLKLLNIFQERELDQQILINKLLEEEKYQMEAFEALQLQKDIQHQEIIHQIHLIEKELSNLTVAEVKKKDLRISSEMNVLAEHRTALAALLSELLSAKEKRENELQERLQQMELKRVHEMGDYWLIQYQKLLDRKPKGIIDAELGIDKTVKKILISASAVNFLPLFAAKRITLSQLLTFTIRDLKKVGVLDDDLCIEILKKAKEFKSGDGKESMYDEFSLPLSPEPSAPPEETLEEMNSPEMLQPSAPPFSPDVEMKLWCQAECVICLDVQSTAVFLPCGHVCCCQNCSNSVESCPLCRSGITSRFVLTIS